MVDKGKISYVTTDGKAIVIPSNTSDAVTCPLEIPSRLSGALAVNDCVVYATFCDNTGIILERMSGR